MSLIPLHDLGGGVSLKSRQPSKLNVEATNGESSAVQRAIALGSYFLSGAMVINASQIFSAPLYLVNKDWYNAWIAFTKKSFGLLTMTMTQWWAPTVVKVSGDKSMRGQLRKATTGELLCNFPKRLVLIANHQIYTDWLYLWWIAYTNRMHGRIYIVLKESLKRIPVLGWGMQLSQFIFMKRNWEKDKPNMQKHLSKLNQSSEPMWLVLFPEGTNLAPDTRAKSRAWARKTGVNDMQHQLLPRTTGLQFCLQELRETVDYLYDCTIAYEGVKRGEYAQDIYTIKTAYLEGHPPKAVHMYWRRWAISSIPLKDAAIFERWLQARWREKDYLLEMWYRNGKFPADFGYLEAQVRPAQWYEFLQIFAPMGVLAMVLKVFYDALVVGPSMGTPETIELGAPTKAEPAPSRKIQPSLSKKIEPAPSKKIQPALSRKIESAPPKKIEPAPPRKIESAPPKKVESAPSKKIELAPPKKVEPAPSRKIESVPSKKIEPAPSRNIQPAPSKKIEPAPSKKIQSAPSKKIESAPPKKIQPTPSKKIEPAPSKKIEPVPAKKIESAASRKISLAPSAKTGTFWDALKAEESARNGVKPVRKKA